MSWCGGAGLGGRPVPAVMCHIDTVRDGLWRCDVKLYAIPYMCGDLSMGRRTESRCVVFGCPVNGISALRKGRSS